MFKWIEKLWWTRFFKNPPKPYNSYLGVVMNWVVVGILFVIALEVIAAFVSAGDVVSGRIYGIILGVVLVIMAVWLGLACYQNDCKHGFYDAIHRAHLDYWHKKRKEYGLE